MKHHRRRFTARILALLFCLPLIAGCIFVDDEQASVEDKAELEVYGEYQKDPVASTARFLKAWQPGVASRSQGFERSRWIAIAGLLSHRKQGPLDEFRHFLVDSLDEANPALGAQAARELTGVAGADVVNALLDKVESPVADAALSEAAAVALLDKIDMQLFSQAEGDREVLLDRLSSACASQQRTPQMGGLCELAKPALVHRADEKRLETCARRAVESPAACIHEATR